MAADVKSLNIDELTGLVNLYPWFGLARKELCARMAAISGNNWGEEQFADAALYVVSREKIFNIFRDSHKADYSDKDALTLVKAYVETPKAEEGGYKRTVRVVGGDFFSQDEYDSVKKDGDDAFAHLKLSSESEKPSRSWEDPILGFCTETLAEIYADQGYFAEAKKIYSRLILRYPEKSAYFASLIEKLSQEN